MVEKFVDKISSIKEPKISNQSLWFKGPDRKFYATREGLEQAWNDYYNKYYKLNKIDLTDADRKIGGPEKMKFRQPDDELIGKELLKRIRQLAGLTPKELDMIRNFLNSVGQSKKQESSNPIDPLKP